MIKAEYLKMRFQKDGSYRGIMRITYKKGTEVNHEVIATKSDLLAQFLVNKCLDQGLDIGKDLCRILSAYHSEVEGDLN